MPAANNSTTWKLIRGAVSRFGEADGSLLPKNAATEPTHEGKGDGILRLGIFRREIPLGCTGMVHPAAQRLGMRLQLNYRSLPRFDRRDEQADVRFLALHADENRLAVTVAYHWILRSKSYVIRPEDLSMAGHEQPISPITIVMLVGAIIITTWLLGTILH